MIIEFARKGNPKYISHIFKMLNVTVFKYKNVIENDF